MWPDVELINSPIFLKRCPKRNDYSFFNLKIDNCLSSPNITKYLSYFVRKIVAQELQKLPKMVTLKILTTELIIWHRNLKLWHALENYFSSLFSFYSAKWLVVTRQRCFILEYDKFERFLKVSFLSLQITLTLTISFLHLIFFAYFWLHGDSSLFEIWDD